MPAVDHKAGFEKGHDAAPTHVALITPGPDDLAFVTDAVRVDAATTLSVVTQSGDTVDMKFVAGETRRVRLTKITAATGTPVIEAMG